MGNNSSSGRGHQDESVDFGALVPQGIYTGPRDWNHQVTAQAIVDRKLAPFYRPLEDYEEGWDDDKILAHRKEPPSEEGAQEGGSTRPEPSHSSSSRHHKRAASAKQQEANRLSEASLYRGAVECPICFLYYPPNINYSRCCGQALCTECFVQIKRAEPTATHLESEPAACPYCVRTDFGVVYTPPAWRTGMGSDGAMPPSPGANAQPNPKMLNQRRKSFGANDPEVVTTDHIRPDWEAKLDAVRAAVQRRANRRIIMRQVGDRLIPVGISSGRVQILPNGEDGQQAGEAGEGSGNGTPGSGAGSSRRSRRRERELNRLLGMIGGNTANYPAGVMGAQDLEELMIAEAMRLSMQDEEDRQKKEQEEEAKKGKQRAASTTHGAGPSTGPGSIASTSSPSVSSPDAAGSTSSASTSPATASSAALPLPAVTGSSLLPPPSKDARGRNGHRPSSSISAVPDTPPTGASAAARARSQPPGAQSAISSAMRSALSAAAAVVAPRGDDARSTRSASVTPPATSPAPVAPVAEPARSATPKPVVPAAAPATSPPAAASPPEPLPAASSPAEQSPSPAPAATSSPAVPALSIPVAIPSPTLFTPSSTFSSAQVPTRPSAQHAESFASSVFSNDSDAADPASYDVLSSSPESDGGLAVDHEPLLRAEAPVARRMDTGLSGI